MPEPKMVPEREAVRREREAFRLGAEALYIQTEVPGIAKLALDRVQQYADVRYPLPKVVRPRVVTDAQPGCSTRSFRYVDGQIQTTSEWDEGRWVCLTNGTNAVQTGESGGLSITPARIRLLADLIARPTEEVPADD